jgi:hypothetical protein
VVRLDAAGGVIPDGDPTEPAPVRFVGVTGHFSTFAVVLVSPIDTTPPVISGVPADIVAEATSAAGAVVAYTAPTAVDDRDGPRRHLHARAWRRLPSAPRRWRAGQPMPGQRQRLLPA